MMGGIIFTIIFTTLVSLIINSTASAVIDDYKARFGSEVSLTPNMEKLQQAAQQASTDGKVRMSLPTLTAEQYLKFADSEYLQKSVLTGEVEAKSDQIRAIDQSEDSAENSSFALPGAGGPSGMVPVGANGDFKLLGDSFSDFEEGKRALQEAGSFPKKNEALISQELSEENSIAVGDTVTFVSKMTRNIPDNVDKNSLQESTTYVLDDVEYTVVNAGMGGLRLEREVSYELKVSGIYTDLEESYNSEFLSNVAIENRRNNVFTTLDTLLEPRFQDEEGIRLEATYFLLNPDLLESFEQELRTKGLPETFEVSADANSYNTIVKPVLALKNIALTFMIVVFVLGAMILLLLSAMSIRERKYEIGVLRAMGMKKSKVALGLWAETLMITGVCLLVGIGVGVAAAQPISDAVLASQVVAAESSSEENQQVPGMVLRGGPPGMPGFAGQSNAQPLSEMKVSFETKTLVQITAFALLLASLSGFISVRKITKYEPIKILMDRN